MWGWALLNSLNIVKLICSKDKGIFTWLHKYIRCTKQKLLEFRYVGIFLDAKFWYFQFGLVPYAHLGWYHIISGVVLFGILQVTFVQTLFIQYLEVECSHSFFNTHVSLVKAWKSRMRRTSPVGWIKCSFGSKFRACYRVQQPKWD